LILVVVALGAGRTSTACGQKGGLELRAPEPDPKQTAKAAPDGTMPSVQTRESMGITAVLGRVHPK